MRPAACPEGSAVGEVDITSPVLDRSLTGRAYVGAQSAVGALPDLYIEAALGTAVDAPRVKLIGKLSVSDDNRLVTVLDDIPQVPVSEFELTFRGGAQSALVTPPTCREGQGTIVATPRGGAAPTTVAVPYVIDQDCAAAGAFTPNVSFGSADGQAGGNGTFTTTISRPDRSQRLARTVIDLPPGQVANLKGVPECPQDVAARGACDPSTRVGSVTALAGVGPAPYRITGSVFLTSRSEGSVAGISIHVPVVLGGVDLGSLDVPARIEIRPEDLGLRIRADVPERFKGAPARSASARRRARSSGVPAEPDELQPAPEHVAVHGHRGRDRGGDGRLPDAELRTAGFRAHRHCSRDRPDDQQRPPEPQRADRERRWCRCLRRAAVMLPSGLSVDLKQLPRACPQDTFRAGGCPENAKIGTVNATLSITDEPLGGSIYLSSPPRARSSPGSGSTSPVGSLAGWSGATRSMARRAADLAL